MLLLLLQLRLSITVPRKEMGIGAEVSQVRLTPSIAEEWGESKIPGQSRHRAELNCLLLASGRTNTDGITFSVELHKTALLNQCSQGRADGPLVNDMQDLFHMKV